MGTSLLHFSSSSPSFLFLNPNTSNFSNCSSSSRQRLLCRKFLSRWSSSRWRATGGPRWDNRRFGFDPEDDVGRGGAKKRRWWSDYDDDLDDDDDWEVDDEDDDGEFWVFKVLRGLGWMLPAIGVSVLLGTDPNAILMALAVPLAQAVVSLVVDKAWGRTSYGSRYRPKTRTRRRPVARAATASNVRTSYPKQGENVTGGETRRYKSSVGGDFGPFETGGKGFSSFGGWDDLDRPTGTQKVPRSSASEKANGLPKQQYRRKLSRMGRVREKPLFLRLLVAAFPFLGSWTRLLF